MYLSKYKWNENEQYIENKRDLDELVPYSACILHKYMYIHK